MRQPAIYRRFADLLLREMARRGQDVIIADRGRPVARLLLWQ
jgi:antitoxin (DNA-binding transcriptional repressor) of toxin-antitoxin stability system